MLSIAPCSKKELSLLYLSALKSLDHGVGIYSARCVDTFGTEAVMCQANKPAISRAPALFRPLPHRLIPPVPSNSTGIISSTGTNIEGPPLHNDQHKDNSFIAVSVYAKNGKCCLHPCNMPRVALPCKSFIKKASPPKHAVTVANPATSYRHMFPLARDAYERR